MKIGSVIGEGSLKFDLDVILNSRLLVQANSGGGKSYALRKLLEETHGRVQHVILDLEGEFATLREQFDYVLIGKGSGADVQVDLKSAELLAKKLLELNVSAIIDLYELRHYERILFVRRFLESMINAPKQVWHQVMVVVDEAHIFCPQSTKAESSLAVIDLCTRGRKRGFCAVLATQRISKLHKDAAAECNNKLIGRTGLDVDMKRAAEELGFTSKEDVRSLRELNPGEFFAFGSGLSNSVIKIKIGKVKTTHPEAGKRIGVVVTKPTDKIKGVLQKLSDLPQKASEELIEREDFLKKIRSLEAQLRVKSKIPILPAVSDKEKSVEVKRVIVEANRLIAKKETEFKKVLVEKDVALKKFENQYVLTIRKLSDLLQAFPKIRSLNIKLPDVSSEKLKAFRAESLPIKQVVKQERNYLPTRNSLPVFSGDEKLGGGALRMLKAAVMYHPNEISKARMGAIAGLSFGSGSFGTYLASLKRIGALEQFGEGFIATDRGVEIAGNVTPLPTDPESLVDMWARIVKGGASRMLRALAEAYPNSLSKEELGESVGMSHVSGSFGTYLATLKRNGLIKVNGSEVKASEELFEGG